MADKKTKDAKARHGDTTLFRLAPTVPFNARVEPIWHNVERLQRKLGLIHWIKERGRTKRVVELINDALRAQGVEPNDWEKVEGSCVCNLRMEKIGVLADLQTYARDCMPDADLRHIHCARDKNAYFLPLEFQTPLTIRENGAEIPVGSAPRLSAELAMLAPLLEADDFLDTRKMVNYLHASKREIASFDSKALRDPQFWAKFGHVVLRKLTEASLESKMPIIFA